MEFQLSEDFLKQYKNKQPSWGPLGYVTFKRTYSRLKEDGTTEEWFDCIKRVVEGCFTIQMQHCYKFNLPWNPWKAQKSAQKMFKKIWNFKFLPPGRGLWVMGTNIVEKHGGAALNNCAFVSTENIKNDLTRPFEFLMDMSMLGVGVGFDTLGANILEIKGSNQQIEEFIIPDSREGWVESVKKLLLHFFKDAAKPKFDYSVIRPAGEPIKTFGGTASGSGPLEELHNNIFNLLKTKKGELLSSCDIVDIMNMIGVCVVAGNVRRTAEIAFAPLNDEDFMNLKQDTEKLESHRWASNNSVIVNKGDDYTKAVEKLVKNGEPGFFWLNNAREYGRMKDGKNNKDYRVKGGNPCLEQSLESYEMCCLVETFPSRHETPEEYLDTLKYAYMYAKTVTLSKTHWPETNAVMLRNRRIGTSQTGIIDSFVKHGRRTILEEFCDKGYKELKSIDKKYSDWLCVPKSIKMTSVKPSGTVSLLPGVSPGIHYPHSKYYIRRIRFDKNSPLVKKLEKVGYKTEPCIYSKTSSVVEFPIKEELFEKGKEQVTVWEQFENAAQYQHYWADNQVSVTISFKPEESLDLKNALELYESRLKGVSFLPLSDHGYKQAPYETITKEKFEKSIKKLKNLDLSDTLIRSKGSKYCDSDHCEI